MPVGALFIGSKDLGYSALKMLLESHRVSIEAVVTCNDPDDVRSKLGEFRSLAKASGVPLIILDRPSKLVDVLLERRPSLCLVVGWYWIIEDKILSLPEMGFLGLHASLLPRYRGASPLVWPIIRGETHSGVSLFRLDAGMDTGYILGQAEFEIGGDDTIAVVMAKAESSMLELIARAVPAYMDGTLKPLPQSNEGISYGSQRIPSDGLIDWGSSSTVVHNFIRAQSHPYPGAFTFLEDGRTMHIWAARPFEHAYYGIAGQVAQFIGEDAVVCCGNGAIVLERVGLAGEAEIKPKRILKYNQRLGKHS